MKEYGIMEILLLTKIQMRAAGGRETGNLFGVSL